MKIEFTIPNTQHCHVSEANRSNENRFIKKKRHITQQWLIKSYYKTYIGLKQVIPCQCTLTRIAPRQFDFDNLVSSFKYLRDYLAESMIPGLAKGRADDEGRGITWIYKQEKGKPKEYAIRVTIESSAESSNQQ